MIIRKASRKDFEEISEIIKEEYGKRPYNERWTISNAVKTLDYYSNWGRIYVAEIDKKIVGFMVIHKEFYNHGPKLHIKEIAVNSRFQGKGVGKALMEKAEEFAKNHNIKTIYLFTSSDAKAFEFYKKIGYSHSKKTVFLDKELR